MQNLFLWYWVGGLIGFALVVTFILFVKLFLPTRGVAQKSIEFYIGMLLLYMVTSWLGVIAFIVGSIKYFRKVLREDA